MIKGLSGRTKRLQDVAIALAPPVESFADHVRSAAPSMSAVSVEIGELFGRQANADLRGDARGWTPWTAFLLIRY